MHLQGGLANGIVPATGSSAPAASYHPSLRRTRRAAPHLRHAPNAAAAAAVAVESTSQPMALHQNYPEEQQQEMQSLIPVSLAALCHVVPWYTCMMQC